MKKIPIHLEKITPQTYKFIEWKLHNVCNYNCSFCGDDNKDGSQRWLSIDKYKEYVDKIVKSTAGQPLWVQITGGEPTLYPNLIELLLYMKSHGIMISLITNGTRTIRWWKEFVENECIDTLFLTCHTEQKADYNHLINVLNLFHDKPVETICLVTHTKKFIDESFNAIDIITANTGATVVSKAMNYVNYNIPYTKEQAEKFKGKTLYNGILKDTKTPFNIPRSHQMPRMLKMTYNNGETSTLETSQDLMKNDLNHFLDWTCEVGMHNVIIEYNKVFRGNCGAGNLMSDLDIDDFYYASDPVTCHKQTCFCATNLGTKKYISS